MANRETVSYSEFRAHLSGYLDKVCDGSSSLVVTRRDGQKFTVAPMDETAYLMSTEANKKALLEALNGDPKNRIRYNSVDELREELGL